MERNGQEKNKGRLWISALAIFAVSFSAVCNAAEKQNIFLFLPAITGATAGSPVFGSPPAGNGKYSLLAWNDLGMHCMDSSYEDFAVLPPYNTLWAQLIRRDEEPDIVTSGVSVTYRVLGNTRSDNKTNFWDYAQQLFGLATPLPKNIGLKGFGLQGVMTPKSDHFVAEGIPVTEYLDTNLNQPYPYQVVEVVARDGSGQVLASTQTVLPVSTEMHCEYCHKDNGSANPSIATGKVKQNILLLHDQKESTGLIGQRPVLCASCHASNALGTAGQAGVPNLSLAIHRTHAGLDDGTMEGTCYLCHPGPQTKCSRGTMFQKGLVCQDCHGSMNAVAAADRQPWLDEPRCGTCHGAAYAENSGKLYRFSTGHEGVYCQACHGSQHAIAPSTQKNDNIQALLLQGHAGTIDVCTVCHTNNPDRSEGPHHDDEDDD